jgi:hypothetical protein
MAHEYVEEPPPNIWDSVNGLDVHPVLHAALVRVKEKIQNGLSGSYNICDGPTRTDHARVLLHELTGYIEVTHLPRGAFSQYVDGNILFNSTIVYASTRYFNGQEPVDLTLESYQAVLEECFEHELAHMKMHQDRLQGGEQLTPESPPTFGESGYAVQQQIRMASDTRNHVVLQAPRETWERDYLPPLNLYLHPYGQGRLDILPQNGVTPTPVTLEQLRAHMAHPLATGSGFSRARSEPTDSPDSTRKSKKAKTTGNNNDDSETLGTRGQVKSSLVDIFADPPDGSPSQICTDEAGVDYAERIYPTPVGMDPKKWTKLLSESAIYCKVENVVFCDSQRMPKESFKPSEAIFVLVTFKNPTSDDAFIYCGGNGTFQRTGVRLEIVGEQRYYIPTSPSIEPQTRIRPGASYTFFRQLSIGAPSTPLRVCMHKLHFETPQKKGTYAVAVKYQHPFFTFSGSFKLNISERTIRTRSTGSLTTGTPTRGMGSAGSPPAAIC